MSIVEGVRKIALVGTSCVGKTTLVEHYRKSPPPSGGITIVSEAAREFFSQNQVFQRFSEESQGRIQSLAIVKERVAYNFGNRVIMTDRSVVDAPVYVRAAGDEEGAARLLDRVRFWLPTYDAFLLLDPQGVPYQTDSVRQEDVDARERIHEEFMNFFSNDFLPYELVSGTLEDRIRKIDQIIG